MKLNQNCFSGSSQGSFKILPKSPINIRSPQKFPVGSTIRTADGKTIIIGSPNKQQQQQQHQQIIIRPSNMGGGMQTKDNMTQQIIRIPATKVVSSSEAGIQQIQTGSKVQYVRVISTQAVKFILSLNYNIAVVFCVVFPLKKIWSFSS
jgi:hypothetical protein